LQLDKQDMSTAIFTEDAPAPIGPYSQAIKAGNMLFVSGQIAIDPKSGQLLEGDIKAETKQVLENLKAVVLASGFQLAQVAKCSIFLRSMEDFLAVNEVYAQYFEQSKPARETVAVSGLPKNVRVEISAIALQDLEPFSGH
jgi:2-iminobutanoate/2-iminopropanoate deaminase